LENYFKNHEYPNHTIPKCIGKKFQKETLFLDKLIQPGKQWFLKKKMLKI